MAGVLLQSRHASLSDGPRPVAAFRASFWGSSWLAGIIASCCKQERQPPGDGCLSD